MKKSFRDLSQKRARTVFTIITIAVGVASMGLFAVMPLVDQAVLDEIDDANMFNVLLEVEDVVLDPENKEDLSEIDNVDGFEARTIYYTRIYVGERRDDAMFVGVEDFSNQEVDVVIKDSGVWPGLNQVLTDSNNADKDVFSNGTGKSVRVIRSDGSEVDLPIVGTGHGLIYSGATTQGMAVFYTDIATVRELGNLTGYNVLTFRLEDTDEKATELTIEEIRDYLTNKNEENLETPVVAFSNLPEVREEGTWPGKEIVSGIVSLFYVITVLALICSVFLISNTMNTIVSEQTQDIASMKAIGGTGRQVMRSYLTTSFIMGAIGSLIGAVCGLVITTIFVSFIANMLTITTSFKVHFLTFFVSILAGIGITVLASWPALHKALKFTVREGMESHGITSTYGTSKLDKMLMRAPWLPRPIQMGLRNIGRKKGRSISTLLQVALAVGALLGIMAVQYSLSDAVEEEYGKFPLDIVVAGQEGGSKPLTEDLVEFFNTNANLSGKVANAEPFIETHMESSDENQLFGFGMIYNTKAFKYQDNLVKGRWFTAEDDKPGAPRVVVISEVLVTKEDIKLGDTVTFMTATGAEDFEVVGVVASLRMNGMTQFFPYNNLKEVLQRNNTVTGFMIFTTSTNHKDIDKVSTLIEDEMMAEGYMVQNEIMYVTEEDNQQNNQQIATLMGALGSLIVLITLIGLMNTLTMNILERTKEIGILRCIGSRAWDIRMVFGSEGFAMGLLGWVVGIPMGFVIGRIIWEMLLRMLDVEAPYLYPVKYILYVLLVTVGMTLLIIQFPLRRATRMKPGDALRYQ